MDKHPIYLVLLRRPYRSNIHERRSDPFWEFGSFGCTGCHSRNLLHPKNAAKLDGARLAFSQGGDDGCRLVFVTPPIQVRPVGQLLELRWKPARMPFKYNAAPILVANDGRSHVPLLKARIRWASRKTLEGKLASCFRSKASPLAEPIANQLVRVYERARAKGSAQLARCYTDALPYPPPTVDGERKTTYRRLLAPLKKRRRCGCSRSQKAKQKGRC